jgi:GH43 family beta-xylosidase
MLAVDRLDAPDATAGRASTILRPSHDWQIYERERPMYGAVHDWHTLEGPFVRRRGDRCYCFYSGGSWLGETYGVACAVADHPLGPWTDLAPGPLLRTVPGHVTGPGHNCVVSTGTGDVMVYHAWDPGLTARRMCIDPLRWTAEGPVVDGPSWEGAELP